MRPPGPRTPPIAGNWKMYKTVEEAEAFIGALLPRVSTADGVDVGICPTFTALQAMVDSTRGSRVQVFAQNMHYAAEGAFTGEVAPTFDDPGDGGVEAVVVTGCQVDDAVVERGGCLGRRRRPPRSCRLAQGKIGAHFGFR